MNCPKCGNEGKTNALYILWNQLKWFEICDKCWYIFKLLPDNEAPVIFEKAEPLIPSVMFTRDGTVIE